MDILHFLGSLVKDNQYHLGSTKEDTVKILVSTSRTHFRTNFADVQNVFGLFFFAQFTDLNFKIYISICNVDIFSHFTTVLFLL